MDGHIVYDWELEFRRKLDSVYKILVEAGKDGISKTELTRRTSRMLNGIRERDDILANLDEGGSLAIRLVVNQKGQPKRHFWADKFAPPEDGIVRGEWGRDQGW